MHQLHWEWSARKNALNLEKHKLSFETARLVFADPYQQSFLDPFPEEERWQTYGLVRGILIVVVHTEPIVEGDEIVQQGRIISARKATSTERRAFEEQRND